MVNATQRNAKRVSKAELAEAALAEVLAKASAVGYYGTVSLTLSVQDGHIQHLKVPTERMIR